MSTTDAALHDDVRSGGRTPLRRAGYALLVLLVAVASVLVCTATGGLVRAEVVVLATVLRESRSRVVSVLAVLAVAVTSSATMGLSGSTVLLTLVVLAEALAVRWALVRLESSSAGDVLPGRRFLATSARLGAVIVLGALLEASIGAGATYEERFWAALLPLATAALIAAAIAGRSLLVRADVSGPRLAGPFVALALACIAAQLTTLYWHGQDRTALETAATTATASFQRAVAADLQSFSARASTPTRAPISSQAAFDRTVRVFLFGNQSLSATALLEKRADGGYRVLYSTDRQGDDAAIGPSLGGAPADRAALDASLESGSALIVGVREVPGADMTQLPSIVWAAPMVGDTTAASPRMLTAAVALPVAFAEAVDTLGSARETVDLTLSIPGEGGSATVATLGPAARGDRESASSQVLLGDIPFTVIAKPADGFGTPFLVRAVVLGGLLLLGLVAAALMLQVANARFRSARDVEEREALLAAALAAAPGSVLLVDADERVLMTNGDSDSRPSDVGHTVLDALGFTPCAVDRERLHDLVAEGLRGRSGSLEITDQTSGAGSPRVLSVTVSPVRQVRAGGARTVVQIQDLTDERSRALRAAQTERLRSLGTMAGGLAHDFNNLLFIISGYLQMLHEDDDVAERERLRRYVERASDAAERGAEIASSLLAVARSQPVEATAIEVGTFVRRLSPLIVQAVGSERSVVIEVGDGPLDVLVDSGQLSGSLLNLAINSRDAMEPGGTVRLHVERRHIDDPHLDLAPQDYVVVSVVDDGVGMTPEVAQRAFEPYFTTKGLGDGTGIGLAAVYSFAQQSGGLATIESEHHVGTRVTLYLPAVFAETAQPASPTMPEHATGLKVLVVDDEAALAGLIAGWLTEQGAEVQVADSPAQARRVAAAFGPDVLLTDVRLGDPDGVDGPELADQLLAASPDLAVVFMTGFSDRMDELIERGSHTLAKPFTKEGLLRVLFPVGAGTAGES